jgi:hypothetical protein
LSMPRRTAIGAAVVWLLLALPAAAVSGRVIDPDRKPVVDAQVCQLVAVATEGLCVATDKQGNFTLPATEIRNVRITASGFLPRLLDDDPQGKAVVLERAGALWVQLTGADEKPIGSGDVFLIFPSGTRQGPFPVNEQGVRIRTLPVGRYRVLATVEGLVQERSVTVDVTAGEEIEAAVRLIAPPSKSEPGS